MSSITVVGLGPAGPEFLTVDVVERIESASKVFFRTARHPAAQRFVGFKTFDDIYEQAQSIDDVYPQIVKILLEEAIDQDVLYVVPGSPTVAERTVELLREQKEVVVNVIPAMSFIELAWAALGIDPLEAQPRIVDGHDFNLESASGVAPLLIAQCDTAQVLSDIKLTIDDDEQLVMILQSLGLPEQKVTEAKLGELDKVVAPDHLTSVWIPNPVTSVASSLVSLYEIVRRLRVECPWDAKQTPTTLTKYVLEESYELVEAIGLLADAENADAGDEVLLLRQNAVIEELGDVFLQIFLHAAIGEESGEYSIIDVADELSDKLIYRHPHVFSDTQVDSASEVETNWEQLKVSEGKAPKDDLDIDESLPTLLFAAELRKRIDKRGVKYGGIDWSFKDIAEEVSELREALTEADNQVDDHVINELGDVLLSTTILAATIGVDPEVALRLSANRFRNRMRAFELVATEQGMALPETTATEFGPIWAEAKNRVG